MRRPILQAGLFGGGILILIGFIGLLPYVGLCLSIPLYPLAFFVIGLALVRLADHPPAVGEAAAAGLIAALIASSIGGLAAMFLAPIRLRIAGGPEELTALLSPDTVQSLIDAGLDPVTVMDFVGGVGSGILCCSAKFLTGTLLTAMAAALYAAYRRP